MGLIRGEQTITPFETYLIGSIRTTCLQVLHTIVLFLGTCKRNYTISNEQEKKEAFPKYLLSEFFGILITIIAFFVIHFLNFLSILEYALSFLYSILGTILYKVIGRSDAINTLLWAIEALFPKIEIQKLDIVLQLPKIPCKHEGNRTCCGDLISLGYYNEINWICLACSENYRRLRELGAAKHELRFTNIRGRVFSEFAPLQSSKVISSTGSLAEFFAKEHLIHDVYDVEKFAWRRTYIQLVDDNSPKLKYDFIKCRREVVRYPISSTTDELVIVKSFSHSSKDWNKLGDANYNNKNRGFIKISGSGILLAIQAGVGLLQIQKEADGLKALAILATTQLAWFQVVSEVLLADVPSDRIIAEDFERPSVKRAKGINYLQRGDRGNLFSGLGASWYSKTTLVGTHDVQPVKGLELLLNANRLVTSEYLYDFSNSGITSYKQKLKKDLEDGSWSIDVEREQVRSVEIGELEKMDHGCEFGMN